MSAATICQNATPAAIIPAMIAPVAILSFAFSDRHNPLLLIIFLFVSYWRKRKTVVYLRLDICKVWQIAQRPFFCPFVCISDAKICRNYDDCNIE